VDKGEKRLVEVEKAGEGAGRNADSIIRLRFPLKLSRTEVAGEKVGRKMEICHAY
jgi:hypothetical protein